MADYRYVARVDLSSRKVSYESVSEEVLRECMGGAGLAAWYLAREVPPGVEWDSEKNRLLFMSGPLGGVRLPGTGIVEVLSKGPMTNLAGSSQANGFFGAFLRLNGLLGLIVQGISPEWVYLWIENGQVGIRDASELLGLDTRQTELRLAGGLNPDVSVAAIGPAGENLVRFAAIVTDGGHVAAHNGLGAVMGSKKLKAVAVVKGQAPIPVHEPDAIPEVARRLAAVPKEAQGGYLVKWGTAGRYEAHYLDGSLAVKNYLTNVWQPYRSFTGQELRRRFRGRPKPCWMCGLHCRWIDVPGLGEVEEPEYEAVAAFSSLIDNADVDGMVRLSNLVDRLGLDVNEAGWLLAWVMECYCTGLLSATDLDGVELTWGNVHASEQILQAVAHRSGCGSWLAEGVMRAAEHVGRGSLAAAVGTKRGATLRTHDHRAKWAELLDTCVSSTSTIEATGGQMDVSELGLQPIRDPFDPLDVARATARVNGWRVFDDSCPICRFFSRKLSLLMQAVRVVTGWELTAVEALAIGRRTVNRLRVFNCLHGADAALEVPSERCFSTIADGPCAGVSVAPVFLDMRRVYWTEMGWDPVNGWPLAGTLQSLGLGYERDLLYGSPSSSCGGGVGCGDG